MASRNGSDSMSPTVPPISTRPTSKPAVASSMQRYFRDPRAVRKQNHFFGGVLVLVGAALFFVKRAP